jgi:hypothetical protein
MKKIITPDNESRRFAAVYSVRDPGDSMTQALTQPRESIDSVIADVANRQEREGKICFVQIVDLANLKPVEPYQTTIARLRGAALRHPEVLERPTKQEGVFTFDLPHDSRE